jgi:phospholipid-transporting ATPase
MSIFVELTLLGINLILLITSSFMISLQLFDIATYCKVVLCCRVAPLQKAGIVDLIKSRTDDMTLAIGDGELFCRIFILQENVLGLLGKASAVSFVMER